LLGLTTYVFLHLPEENIGLSGAKGKLKMFRKYCGFGVDSFLARSHGWLFELFA
jgi:hypothetical protein